MIVMKLGGTSPQDAQAIDRVATVVPERLQLAISLSPKLRPTTRQVSGHDFSRAVNMQKNLGFSPCDKTPHQDLKTKFFLPDTARLKSYPDTCLGQGKNLVLFSSAPLTALLRASVPPWWGLSR
jgi:hypothetical protein